VISTKLYADAPSPRLLRFDARVPALSPASQTSKMSTLAPWRDASVDSASSETRREDREVREIFRLSSCTKRAAFAPGSISRSFFAVAYLFMRTAGAEIGVVIPHRHCPADLS